jgi:hypothetical protein
VDLTEDLEEISTAQEKCTKQFVLIVNRNAKFLLNQQKANQFSAENVSLKSQKHLEDSNFLSFLLIS